MIDLSVFPAGYIETNAFLLCDSERGEALLIDAPHFLWDQVEPKLKEKDCSLSALLLTHGHYDHIGDGARIQKMGIEIYGHEADRHFFENPEIMRPYLYPPDMVLDPMKLDHVVEDGTELELMGQTIEVRHVPGHCPGNVLFYFPNLGAAFVGDALFAGSIGRTDLPGGDFSTLERSIKEKIYTLSDETKVFPGHGPATTVGHEKATNPFVSGP